MIEHFPLSVFGQARISGIYSFFFTESIVGRKCHYVMFVLDLTPAVKRRSSDSFSSDSPVKKNRPSFSSPITPPDSDKSVRNNNNSASTPEESPKLNSRPSNL